VHLLPVLATQVKASSLAQLRQYVFDGTSAQAGTARSRKRVAASMVGNRGWIMGWRWLGPHSHNVWLEAPKTIRTSTHTCGASLPSYPPVHGSECSLSKTVSDLTNRPSHGLAGSLPLQSVHKAGILMLLFSHPELSKPLHDGSLLHKAASWAALLPTC